MAKTALLRRKKCNASTPCHQDRVFKFTTVASAAVAAAHVPVRGVRAACCAEMREVPVCSLLRQEMSESALEAAQESMQCSSAVVHCAAFRGARDAPCQGV